MVMTGALPQTAQPRPIWLWAAIGGIVAVGLVIAVLVFAGRKAGEARAATAYGQQEQLEAFQRFVRDRLAEDITRAGRFYGFCQPSCESFWPTGGAVKAWQFRAPDAVLLAFLYGEWDFAGKNLQYRLKLQWSSSRDDGDLAPVAPRLQQLADSILKRFNYPPELLFPTPKAFVERGNSTYGAMQVAYSAALAPDRIYKHTGSERLRGERVANITRRGPFTEEGSWLRGR